MTRRSLLASLLGLPAAACKELRRYHSSVSFQVSSDAPRAGEAFEVTFQYLDAAEPGTYTVALVSSSGAVVDEAPVTDASSRPTLTAPSAGSYGVQFRRRGQMVAHRWINAR